MLHLLNGIQYRLGERALDDSILRDLRDQLGAVILALKILAADQQELQVRWQAMWGGPRRPDPQRDP